MFGRKISALSIGLLFACAGATGVSAQNMSSQISPASQEAGDKPPLMKNNSWKVIVHERSNPLQNNLPSDLIFAIVRRAENGWKVAGFSETWPSLKAGDELFATSKDLAVWQTAIDGWQPACDRVKDKYTVCDSALSKKDYATHAVSAVFSFGLILVKSPPVEYDLDAVKSAVNSISETQARTVLAEFNEEQRKITDKRDEERKIALEQTKIKQEIAAQKSAKIKAEIVKKRNAAPVGAKDFCKVRVTASLVWIVHNGVYDCDTYGEIFVSEMSQEGWVIVNKIPRQLDEHTVYDVLIEKAKR